MNLVVEVRPAHLLDGLGQRLLLRVAAGRTVECSRGALREVIAELPRVVGLLVPVDDDGLPGGKALMLPDL